MTYEMQTQISDNHVYNWDRWKPNRRGRKRVHPLWADSPSPRYIPRTPRGTLADAAFRRRKEAVWWIEQVRKCDWRRLLKRGWSIAKIVEPNSK